MGAVVRLGNSVVFASAHDIIIEMKDETKQKKKPMGISIVFD